MNQVFIKNGITKLLLSTNLDTSGTYDTALAHNEGIALQRLSSDLSTMIKAGDYICFQGDGELSVTVVPDGKLNTIQFECENEDETVHELWNEWNFCLEPSQMTDNGNGKQSVTYVTTGDVDVTATYEYKDKFSLTLRKPNDVAQASYTVSGHKKEMKWKETSLLSSGEWRSVCYGAGKFVAIGGLETTSNVIVYSTDGITWHQAAMPTGRWWSSICYGNGKFVALARNAVGYSVDGVHWNESALPLTSEWNSICYGDGKFIIVGGYAGGVKVHENVLINTALYSFDGINWNTSTLPANQYWAAVAYGRGIYVATAYGGSIGAYSNDGITWHKSTMANGRWWWSLIYSNNIFICTVGSNYVGYTYDGITWYEKAALSYTGPHYSTTYGNGIFVTAPNDTSTKNADYSTDGLTWHTIQMPAARYWRGAAYGDGKFVSIAQNSDKAAYATFYDGVIWDGGGRQSISRDTNAANSLSFNDTIESEITLSAANETISDISIKYLKLITPDPTIEFKKPELPKMSRYMDCSTNPYTILGTTFDDFFTNQSGWTYDSTKGFCTNKDVNGFHCGMNFEQIPGDFSAFAYCDGIFNVRPFTTDGWLTWSATDGGRYKDYYASGCARTHIPFSDRASQTTYPRYLYTIYYGQAKTISLMMQTLTLPINSILYKGGYQSDNNQTNYNATEAVKNVTTEACKKLKIKYGEKLNNLFAHITVIFLFLLLKAQNI